MPGVKGETSNPQEFGQLRAYLAQSGFDQSWINEHTDNSLTRSENAELLKAAMKLLPKGQ